MQNSRVNIIGGGLAGCEAAWQVLKAGFSVRLFEMRPSKMTAAHQTGNFAELVCSNSMKSLNPNSAPGQLKSEMKALDSLIIEAAEFARVPAGQALAVNREEFSEKINLKLTSHAKFSRENFEITDLPSDASEGLWIVASGPLTTSGLAASLQKVCGIERQLYFYDAIAPILSGDNIDMNICFKAGRYEEGVDGDYVNIPLDKAQYEAFVDAVVAAEKMPLHEFEDAKYFESCLPIEVMIERGRETLRFGPMKPVGLVNPVTGHRPWANIQLRMENREGTMYSMVGFQTKMKWPEQKKIFATLPGLADVEILRYGSVHRNTYVNSPQNLAKDFSCKHAPHVFLAGQITGVEGYTESAAIGLLVGRAVVARIQEKNYQLPPANTIIGALAKYVTEGPLGPFQPMNANLGLLPPIQKQRGVSKQDRHAQQIAAAQAAFEGFVN